MKSKNIFILLVICLALGIQACQQDFLNQVPDDRLTIEQIFQRRAESERYLYGIYGRIRDEANQWATNPWVGLADEADMTWARAGYDTYFMNQGSWDPSREYFNFWSHYYPGIRAATFFMNRIDQNAEILRLPEGEGEKLITLYKAEARALRAYFYFCLLRQYGPVVIIPGNDVVDPDLPLEEMSFPRSPYDECVDYIVSQIDSAMIDLPDWYNQDREFGRMSKPFLMAVKARLLLYAASPLYNGNKDYTDFANADGTPLINQTYSEAKWEKAAEASKVIIDLNRFSLYTETDASGDVDPYLSYQNLFLQPWNSEVIWGRVGNDLSGAWETHCTPRFGGGWNGVAVTQQQVDAYRMANGKDISDKTSDYVEKGFSKEGDKYTPKGTYNMWVGREPRFYVSVVYNGQEWMNKEDGQRIIELYNTGNSGKAGSYDFSRTGYLVKKNIDPNSNPRTSRFTRRPLIYFRLGEVYLNYAEALNEYNPGNPDILKYLNLIKERGGIPPLVKKLSQDRMREEIRKERRVELAFETLRYFDTRRWKIAEETDGGPFYGMNVDAGTSLTDEAFYKRTVFETRVFRPAYYLFPIPQSQMDRGQNLVQNPGW